MASSTRTSFRPRPLDNNKQLEIVRDENADLQSLGPIDQADIEATRRITNGHETLDAHNEKVGPLCSGSQRCIVPGAGVFCDVQRDCTHCVHHLNALGAQFPRLRRGIAPVGPRAA